MSSTKKYFNIALPTRENIVHSLIIPSKKQENGRRTFRKTGNEKNLAIAHVIVTLAIGERIQACLLQVYQVHLCRLVKNAQCTMKIVTLLPRIAFLAVKTVEVTRAQIRK